MKPMNEEQVEALFKCEAVLLGSGDGVPVSRAVELFGVDAVEFAGSFGSGIYCNGYGAGGFTLLYLTLRGFLAAASFCNVRHFQEKEE